MSALKSAAAVYRYVEFGSAEMELEIELTVSGHMEPGYGFKLSSATCDGREFPLTADEVLRIEIDRTLAYADADEAAREDAEEHCAEIRRGR